MNNRFGVAKESRFDKRKGQRDKRLGTVRTPILRSTITCPICGHRFEEEMPTNACVFFFECPSCKATLKPKDGDCCVFCSYGSVPCPPIQTGSVFGAWGGDNAK